MTQKDFDVELFATIFENMKNNAMNTLKIGSLLLILLTICGSCNKSRSKSNNSEATISITRFEQALFSADPAAIDRLIPEWKKQYGKFFDHFCYITHLGNPDDPNFPYRIRAFVTDYNNHRIYKRTMEVFPNLDLLTKELTNAFRNYNSYFPDKPVPEIYTYVSGFNQSALSDDSLLAIGLDKYLGSNEPLYREAGFYNYLITNMQPQKMVPDCMNFWAETEFLYNDSVDNLISHMIYKGMVMYFTDAMVPDFPDSLKWGFNTRQLKYLKSYEKVMWAYLIEHKQLFVTDKFTIDTYILEGPFTKDFGRDSPARAAVWIGYRIVESYINRNKGMTISDLMKINDYASILNGSGYNP